MPSVVHRPPLLHRCRRSSTPTPTHCTNRRLHDGVELVERCRDELERQGMFHRLRLMRPAAVGRSIAEPRPLIDQHSFLHHRRHNVYFAASVCGLGDDHPALREFETTNRTVCADQMATSPRWPSMNRPLSASELPLHRSGTARVLRADRNALTSLHLGLVPPPPAVVAGECAVDEVRSQEHGHTDDHDGHTDRMNRWCDSSTHS